MTGLGGATSGYADFVGWLLGGRACQVAIDVLHRRISGRSAITPIDEYWKSGSATVGRIAMPMSLFGSIVNSCKHRRKAASSIGTFAMRFRTSKSRSSSARCAAFAADWHKRNDESTRSDSSRSSSTSADVPDEQIPGCCPHVSPWGATGRDCCSNGDHDDDVCELAPSSPVPPGATRSRADDLRTSGAEAPWFALSSDSRTRTSVGQRQ